MQSRLSARVVGRSLVECSHFVFHRNISHSLLSVRSLEYVSYILPWTSLPNPCTLVGRRYWARKRSSSDKSLSFISWMRCSIRRRYTALCQWDSGFVAGTFTLTYIKGSLQAWPMARLRECALQWQYTASDTCCRMTARTPLVYSSCVLLTYLQHRHILVLAFYGCQFQTH